MRKKFKKYTAQKVKDFKLNNQVTAGRKQDLSNNIKDK